MTTLHNIQSPRKPPERARVKVCGITRVEDALVAAESGADFLGYIFHPASKRYVEPHVAREVITVVRAKFPHVKHVGVFVDVPVEVLIKTATSAGLDFVQMHGNESPEHTAEAVAAGLHVIRAFRVGPTAPLPELAAFPCEFVLVDAFSPQAHGGTGQRVDLTLLSESFPYYRAFVAGGLSPENVAEVITMYHPMGVDVSSGVEIAPGVKDHEKIRTFLREVQRTHDVVTASPIRIGDN